MDKAAGFTFDPNVHPLVGSPAISVRLVSVGFLGGLPGFFFTILFESSESLSVSFLSLAIGKAFASKSF